MKKRVFKILGVLLVAALMVSMCVGAVSAEPTKICDDVSVDIIQGTYFSDGSATYDDDYNLVTDANPVSFQTDLGVLALASMNNYGNYAFSSGAVTDNKYNITNLGGQAANATHQWIVFVNQVYSGEGDKQTLMSVNQNDVVTAFFVAKGNITYAAAQNNATHSVNVTVNSIKELEKKTVSVSLTSGTFTKDGIDGIDNVSGYGALEQSPLSYSIVDWGRGMIALNDLDGVGGGSDYYNTGYSWGVYHNNQYSTVTLNQIPVTAGDTITLCYVLSAYGLSNGGGDLISDGNYYLSSSLYNLTITITSVEFDGTKNSVPKASSGPTTSNLLWAVDMAETYAGENYAFVPDGSPVVKDGAVYFTTWGGTNAQNGVYCYDINTGEKVWATTGITSRSGVTVYDKYLYVGYMAKNNGVNIGGVKCLDITKKGEVVGDTGAICKITDNEFIGLTSTPLFLGGYVWIYSPASYDDPTKAVLYCYDKTLSTVIATIELGEECGGIYASPNISEDGETIYVPGGEGIVAVNASARTKKWTYSVGAGSHSVGTPVYNASNVYFMVAGDNGGGKLYQVTDNGDSCTAGWNVEHATSEYPTTPVVDDTNIYVTGAKGLSAYSLTDGSPQWTHEGGNAVRASPTLATNGIIYYGTYEEGTLYAVTTDNTQKWKLKPFSPSGRYTLFEARPAVLDGVLYVGCEGASTFYAISDSGNENAFQLQSLEKQLQQLLKLQENTNDLTEEQTRLMQEQISLLRQQLGQQTTESNDGYTLINPGSGTITYTTNHPSYPAKSFTFNKMTVAGVLLTSGHSVVTGERWGGLYFSAIDGISEVSGTSKGWVYQVNGKEPGVMANNYQVKYGDTVVFYYADTSSTTPETSSHVYRFKVSASTTVSQPQTTTPTPTVTPTPTTPTLAVFEAASSSRVPVGITDGVNIVNVNGQQAISVDKSVTESGSTIAVTVNEQSVVIITPGAKITIPTSAVSWSGNSASAIANGMTVELLPASVNVPTGGYAV